MIVVLKKEKDEVGKLLLKVERQKLVVGIDLVATSLIVLGNKKRDLNIVQDFDFLVTYFCNYEELL